MSAPGAISSSPALVIVTEPLLSVVIVPVMVTVFVVIATLTAAELLIVTAWSNCVSPVPAC